MPRALAALVLLLTVARLAAAQSNPGHYQGFGDARGFLNIVPPGQDGVLNGPEALQAQGGQYPPHVKDQLDMYGNLVFNVPGLTVERLLEFYKDASLAARDAATAGVSPPTSNVPVTPDQSFGAPPFFGAPRSAPLSAEGSPGAEDPLFLMAVPPPLGRARLSEFLGA